MNTYVHDPGTDIESNLVQPTDRINYPDSESSSQHQPDTQTQSALREFRNNLNYSIQFNIYKLLISWGKAIASIVVLRQISCIDRKGIWVMMMLTHDSLYCLVVLMTMYLIVTVNQMAASNAAPRDPPSPNRNSNEQEYAYSAPSSESGGIDIAREITKKQKFIGRCSTFVETCYFAIFIYGQVLFFLNTPSVCESQDVNNVMLAYILMGYVWMMSPLIFILLACLCLPVMMFIIYIVGRGQASANQNVINNLTVKRFSPDIPGNHDCAICMVEYKDRDKLVQLNCSPMHHFHEACIKRWLGINGQCPICRTRVTEND